MRLLFRVFLVVIIAAVAAPLPAQVPVLKTSAGPVKDEQHFASDSGSYNLSWQLEPVAGAEFEVQEATSAAFSDARQLYAGPDASSAVTGRLDGDYHYRARVTGGEWSAPLEVRVRHHSLRTAILFLGTGAVVFLATAVLIVGGHLRHRKEFANGE